MKVAGFPTSSDIYLEVDGKKVAVQDFVYQFQQQI